MKKCLILMLFFSPCALSSTVQAEQVCLIFPDGWRANIEDSVVSFDDWLYKAAEGKNNNCKSRIVKKEIDLSIKRNEVIPAGKDAIIQKHLNRPDYKSRQDRGRNWLERLIGGQ